MILHCPACGEPFDVAPTLASAAVEGDPWNRVRFVLDQITVEHVCAERPHQKDRR